MGKKKVSLTNTVPIVRDGGNTGDVEVSYKGNTIVSVSDSETAVLETENTVVEGDIEVIYTKPEAETVTIPVYIKPHDATTQTSIGNISGTFGKAVNLSYDVDEGTYNYAKIFWGNSTGFDEAQMVYGYTVITRDRELLIKLYVPDTEAIPSSCDRIIAELAER